MAIIGHQEIIGVDSHVPHDKRFITRIVLQ